MLINIFAFMHAILTGHFLEGNSISSHETLTQINRKNFQLRKDFSLIIYNPLPTKNQSSFIFGYIRCKCCNKSSEMTRAFDDANKLCIYSLRPCLLNKSNLFYANEKRAKQQSNFTLPEYPTQNNICHKLKHETHLNEARKPFCREGVIKIMAQRQTSCARIYLSRAFETQKSTQCSLFQF